MTTNAGDGERRAMGGYHPQYLMSAKLILERLTRRNLEWIRIADPNAGQIDDNQIATPNRLDAYQVKWVQHRTALTWKNLTHSTKKETALFLQLVDGWERLRSLHPTRRVVVHLTTNRIPAYTKGKGGMPKVTNRGEPKPYHLSAFLEQAWKPAQKSGEIDWNSEWGAVWKQLHAISKLSKADFLTFIGDCSLDFAQTLPDTPSADMLAIYNLLIATAASPEYVIEFSEQELLQRLGWTHRYRFRNKHEFPAPHFVYKPIRATFDQFLQNIDELPDGYLGMFGPPGSGKSTFLSRTIRSLPHRSVQYYAYIPDVGDQSALRGESVNFFHDLTMSLDNAGFREKEPIDISNRIELIRKFHRQLQRLGEDFEKTERKTIILIDGLDHIEREQNPERSLLTDLPSPADIPDGVYIVIGSQPIVRPQLPYRVRQALDQEARTIEIGSLAVNDVYTIVENVHPQFGFAEKRRIFTLTDGHPLALTYLLNALEQRSGFDEQVTLLDNSLPYQGEIESQYYVHWASIEGDDSLINLLGLLARMRGAMPMQWVNGWANRADLRKIQRLFSQYFLEDSQGRWTFFHNSFRLFLASKTTDPLPGQTDAECNREFHLALADHYVNSDAPWCWEAVYHYFQAHEFQKVVDIAQFNWFRAQVEALRSIDTIETDTRLAIRAAGKIGDAHALLRLTLAGASFEQRYDALKDSSLPILLSDVGESHLATEYARDGARLRIGQTRALKLSIQLYHAGLRQDALKLFELAEPLEELSGHPISQNKQNTYQLLYGWVRAATLFREPSEILDIIQRVQIEPSWHGSDESLEQSSKHLQNNLLHVGALANARNDDWANWQLFVNMIDPDHEETHYRLCLHSAEIAYEHGDCETAKMRLGDLLAMRRPDDSDGRRSQISTELTIAELAYLLDLPDAKTIAQDRLTFVGQIPTRDTVTSQERISQTSLQFRYARLRFLVEPSLTPRQMLEEAVAITDFSRAEDDAVLARKNRHFIILNLAKLWADGKLEYKLTPAIFISRVEWIIDLIEDGWARRSQTYRLEVMGSREEIGEILVGCAAKHGEETLATLCAEFTKRWEQNPSSWYAGHQRSIIMAFYENGTNAEWCKRWLEVIEPQVQLADVYSRISEGEKQAEAWLELGNFEAAAAMLRQIIRSARGIWHDEDYQMVRWGRWLRKVNQLEPSKFQERTTLFLRRSVHNAEIAATKDDALIAIMQSLFDFAPQQAIPFYQRLLEDNRLTFTDVATGLIDAALDSVNPPLLEIYFVIAEMLIPLLYRVESACLEKWIVQSAATFGVEETVHHIEAIIVKIRTLGISNHRSLWFEAIRDGLLEIDVPIERVGIHSADLERTNYRGSSSRDEPTLALPTGETLTSPQVAERTKTLADLRYHLSLENEPESYNHIRWKNVSEQLLEQLSDPAEMMEMIDLVKGQLGSFSGNRDLAELHLARALRLRELGLNRECDNALNTAFEYTEPSGWAINYAGKTKYNIMHECLASQGKTARDLFVKAYATDLGQRFWNPEQVLIYGDELTDILFDDVPYLEIWQDVELYLDELFADMDDGAECALCDLIEKSDRDVSMDAVTNALADFMILHLDFPAYPVSNAAIKTVANAIVSSSTAVQNSLLTALSGGNEQLIKQALKVVDLVKLLDASCVEPFIETLERLRHSHNFAIRYRANELYCHSIGQQVAPPKVACDVAIAYEIQLPSVTHYDTRNVVENRPNSASVLINDAARTIAPVDHEAKALAQITRAPEDNVLYQAAQKFAALKTQRTWFANPATDSVQLSKFLQDINFAYSHNKLVIAPARNAIAQVAAELYDLEYIASDDWPYLAHLFRSDDPEMMLLHPEPRPTYIKRMGGLGYTVGSQYVDRPEDWVNSGQDALPLLHSRSVDGRIILAECTRLRRVEDNWPYEERISLLRLSAPAEFWDRYEVTQWKSPFAWIKGGNVSNYSEIIDFAPTELVIARDSHYFNENDQSWLGLNPDVGLAMGWHLSDDGLFRWVDDENKIVVESMFWQDGPVQLFSRYEHVEVGSGWLVLITKEGFHSLRQRVRTLHRGGVIKRQLGWLGTDDGGLAYSLLT